MANCFICGCAIPKGAELRRTVYTGASVGGFNIFSNVILNFVLNSLLSNKRQSVRSYYSTRTICSSCDKALATRERHKIIGVLMLVGFPALVGFVILMARH